MLYNTKNIYIPSNDELNTIGSVSNSTTRYINPNLPGLYVDSNQQIYIPSTPQEFYKYAINVLPYRASTNVQLYGHVYKGTIIENPQIIAFSNNILFSSLLGIALEESTYCALLNIGAKSITTNTKVKYYCVFNFNMNFIFSNKLISNGTEFVYLQNCIVQQEVNIKYSTIFHPLQLTNFRPLYTFLESGNETVRFNILSNITNLSAIDYVTLSRLKMLFSIDGTTWYKYNASLGLFQQINPSASYFTFSELCSEGNDYQTYCAIPLAKFSDTFGASIEKIQVISNGWVLPRYVRHSRYADKIDQGQFIWNNSGNIGKRTVYIGDI